MKTAGADELRDELVEKIKAKHEASHLPWSAEVERALRTVPRHLFTGDASLEKAYSDDALVTKRDEQGQALSSVSAPWLQAAMLGQLDVGPGDRVLEIGSGGYNAALVCELVGPTGSVTSVDIDPFVTDRARRFLDDAGYDDVEVICQDAEFPIGSGRSFDKILVTVGAWDIAPSWLDQLTDDGMLVVPLRTFGMTRSWALRRSGDRLVSESDRQCGFVSMRGAGAWEMRYVDIADGVHLRLDEGQQVDLDALEGILALPREEAWAGVRLPPHTILADLDLWLATRLTEKFVLLTAQEEAVDSGVVTPSWRFGTPAVFDGSTFSYRSALSWTGREFDLGAYAHGPAASAVAGRMVEHMRAWVEAGNPSPVLHAFPARTPDGDLPEGTVLDKRHSRIVLTFAPEDEKGTR